MSTEDPLDELALIVLHYLTVRLLLSELRLLKRIHRDLEFVCVAAVLSKLLSLVLLGPSAQRFLESLYLVPNTVLKTRVYQACEYSEFHLKVLYNVFVHLRLDIDLLLDFLDSLRYFLSFAFCQIVGAILQSLFRLCFAGIVLILMWRTAFSVHCFA